MARHRLWAGWGESFNADGDLTRLLFDCNRLAIFATDDFVQQGNRSLSAKRGAEALGSYP